MNGERFLQTNVRNLTTAMAVMGAMSVAAAPAAAQDRDRSRGLLEEIVVTAKQRE
ncbi:MAG: hypothetical protein JJU27_19210 [Gammaproteobacteria bacterium]|nr:hypothetical protein [Gammaproteobacteria bacterium]